VSARHLDVSQLPPVAFGHRATLWWGVLGLIAIEGTMFALLVATYLYLRLDVPGWPPAGTPEPGLAAATADLAVALASLVPMARAHRAALREQARPAGIGLAIAALAAVVALGLRGLEFQALGCRWDDHAYGSIAWTVLGMHAAHLVASAVEGVLLAIVLLRGRPERKHLVDATSNAIYWYFVVLSWPPLYALVSLGPRFL
jgi:heme/copper-type cytochrome/quinol oxidase subunit 3